MGCTTENKTAIGVGHLVRALQLGGFGHEEIMALREAVLTGDFEQINFCDDCFSEDWEDNIAARMKGYPTEDGFMGFVRGKGYQQFEAESDYYEYCESKRA